MMNFEQPLEDLSGPTYVQRNNRTTYVILPIEEYERLLELDAKREMEELTAMVEDKTVSWIPAEDSALQIAASRIARARKQAGLPQKQLAAKLGVPQSQISRIEKKPDHAAIPTMKRIAKALGVDIAALISFAAHSKTAGATPGNFRG